MKNEMHPHLQKCSAQSPSKKRIDTSTVPGSASGAFLPVTPLKSGRKIENHISTCSWLSMEKWETARLSRRQMITTAIVVAASVVLGNRRPWAATRYPKTIKLLESARAQEMAKYYQYMAFGRKAKEEDYKGIAYLFTALAAAELIHAQNFEKILSRLDVEISRVGKPRITVAQTHDNLMKAADEEINDIDTFYPSMIAHLKPEGFHDAITFATFAWESEKQHRDILMKIQRWAPWFFEKVAKNIDEETDKYFVCQFCGSTVDEIPSDTCPICHLSSEHYRKIEYPI
ncbi:rubrerythrin family protein [Nitrospira sp.]|uniref:rubrerythrin family protein n=2 Tax=unclassified Nitrospira TaxID=2652172 RepID=UPI003FCDCFB4